MLILTKAQMKLTEKLADQSGLSYKTMMKNAGTVAYEYIQTTIGIEQKKCVILAGNGNNAGDGFVMAKLFNDDKADVTVIMCMGEPQTELSIENFNLMKNAGVEIVYANSDIQKAKSCIACSQLIIDAIFGIGFHGELNALNEDIITSANDTNAVRIALDVPSGINSDSTKMAKVCFDAHYTLSFAAYKYAQLHSPSKEKCGKVEVLDIGISSTIIHRVLFQTQEITKDMVVSALPPRDPQSNKGSYGKLLNIAGSLTMGGAAMMSTLSAMRIGAGIVRLATPKSVAEMVAPHLMEAMTVPLEECNDGSISISSDKVISDLLEKSTACIAGCGISVVDNTKQLVEYVIKNAECGLVIDADGLNCIAGNTDLLKSAKKIPIITPHIGEMARLVDMSVNDVINNSESIARVFAGQYNCVVVLKSHKTIIASPEGELFVNTAGNAGLAKGGSGDVLAGMIGGLLTQGLSPLNSAICGVYLHASAADSLAQSMSLYSMLARDLIDEIPYVLKQLNR